MKHERIYNAVILLSILTGAVLFGSVFSNSINEPSYHFLAPVTVPVLPSSANRQEPVAKPKPVSLVFGGDVMLSRQVGQRMVKYDDYTWPFLNISPLLSGADLSIVNLESPFVYGKDYFVPTGSMTFRVDPKAVAGLEYAGVDIADLANNHFANAGRKGMEDTFSILNDAGIKYIGAGMTEQSARQGVEEDIGGTTFAFLGFAYPQDYTLADSETAGIVGMDEEKAAQDVKRLADKGDVVVVVMHAGIEYTREPNWQQKEFARAMIDAGASLVVGHHPHWPQVPEVYKGKLIAYSLGNLVFDQMWSQETRQGLMLDMLWEKDRGFYEADFVPVKISDYGQPAFMEDGEEKDALLSELGLPADGKLSIIPQ